MENVLTKKNEIRGFIDSNGILIRVANIDLGGDSVEMMAESIARNIEKCTEIEIEEFTTKLSPKMNRIFQYYLVQNFGYIYIHIKYLEDGIKIEELVRPNDIEQISELQRTKISALYKGTQLPDITTKILEKKRGKDINGQ